MYTDVKKSRIRALLQEEEQEFELNDTILTTMVNRLRQDNVNKMLLVVDHLKRNRVINGVLGEQLVSFDEGIHVTMTPGNEEEDGRIHFKTFLPIVIQPNTSVAEFYKQLEIVDFKFVAPKEDDDETVKPHYLLKDQDLECVINYEDKDKDTKIQGPVFYIDISLTKSGLKTELNVSEEDITTNKEKSELVFNNLMEKYKDAMEKMIIK